MDGGDGCNKYGNGMHNIYPMTGDGGVGVKNCEQQRLRTLVIRRMVVSSTVTGKFGRIGGKDEFCTCV